jgi:hypothetical protein
MLHAERLELPVRVWEPCSYRPNCNIHHRLIIIPSSSRHHRLLFLSSTPSTTHVYENRSPFLLLNTSLASYLLFSLPSASGACLVAAGSWLACKLGFPLPSVARSSRRISPASAPLSAVLRGAAVLELTTALGEMVGFDDVCVCSPCACSSWNCRWRFTRSASAFCARSALMDFFAK